MMYPKTHKSGGAVRRLAAVLAVALVLVLPATALAQNTASSDEYKDSAGLVQQQVNQGGSGEVSDPSGTGLSSSVGPLPFTGFDVIAMAVVALAVTGLGLGLQRAVSRPGNEL